MKIYLNLFIIILIANLSGCISDDGVKPVTSEAINMKINHYQQTGIGVSSTLNLLVQEGEEIGSDEWKYFYSSIEGFNYEPGYIYGLSVIKEGVKQVPAADASSLKYQLEKVISKVKVSEETVFYVNLKVSGENFVTGNQDIGYKVLDRIAIDCDDLCLELNTKLMSQSTVIGKFKHLSNNRIKLIGFK